MYFHVNLNFSKFNQMCICWWANNILLFAVLLWTCSTEQHMAPLFVYSVSGTNTSRNGEVCSVKLHVRVFVFQCLECCLSKLKGGGGHLQTR